MTKTKKSNKLPPATNFAGSPYLPGRSLDPAPAIFSIKQPFAAAILAGAKTLEIRKTDLTHLAGRDAYIYACKPVQLVVGGFRIGCVDLVPSVGVENHALNVERMWETWGARAAISRDDFLRYWRGWMRSASALEVSEPWTAVQPLAICSPPQTWRYVKPGCELNKLASLTKRESQ